MWRVAGCLVLAALLCVLQATADQGQQGGQTPAGDTVETGSIRQSIDSIRTDLVELRFEAALAAIEGLSGASGMTEVERAELLVLRSQAHVAFGDFEAAGQDFREILTLRPAFEPDPSLTPRKALDLFETVQATMVGMLSVEIDPVDARLFVDGQPRGAASGELVLLAGEHELRVEQEGFDEEIRTVAVPAGKTESVRFQLVPNSRTIVVRTEPEAVEVLIDGESIGQTERASGGGGELVIPNVALGEHRIEMRKECFRTEAVQENLTVDLLDRSPKRLRVVVMQPVRSTVVFEGAPTGATIAVDGNEVGRLPVDSLEICPGRRRIEIRSRGRLLWGEERTALESEKIALAVLPRPSIALVGAEEWPVALATFADRFNRLDPLPLPDPIDPANPAGWNDVQLPAGADLALAVVPAAREGLRERWYLYSPILRVVYPLEAAPRDRLRPRWHRLAWGMSLVDSELAGNALVVDVAPGGAAASAGLTAGVRLTAVAGQEVGSAVEARAALKAVGAGLVASIDWVAPDGGQHRAEVRAGWTPWIRSEYDDLEQAIELAAWALVDSLVDADRAPAALSNLALLFSGFGHHDLAAETWRRVRFAERAGIGEGTVQYYLARDLERLGREEDATRAYRKAAASLATAIDDEGPLVAPAARDRLADLGVTD